MEIVRREKVDTPDDFRIRQLRARDMLRGDLEGVDLEEYVQERVVTTKFEQMLNWARSNSMFPLTFGLACCAIESPIALVSARYDLARFGAEALRASPRQADFIILSGRASRARPSRRPTSAASRPTSSADSGSGSAST